MIIENAKGEPEFELDFSPGSLLLNHLYISFDFPHVCCLVKCIFNQLFEGQKLVINNQGCS
jgi:hypothetical protein